MQYAVRNENGEHVREPRNHAIGEGRKGHQNPTIAARFAARFETGFAVNLDRAQQKALRRSRALERAQLRKGRTSQQQLLELEQREGFNARERVRIAMLENDVEYANNVLNLLIAMNNKKMFRFANSLRKQFAVPNEEI